MRRHLHFLILTLLTLQMAAANATGKGGEGGNTDRGGKSDTGGKSDGGGGKSHDRGGNHGGGDHDHGRTSTHGPGGNGGDRNSDNGNHSYTHTTPPPNIFTMIFGKRRKEPVEPKDRKPPRKPEKEPKDRKPRPPIKRQGANGGRSCDERYPYLSTLKNQPAYFSVYKTVRSLQGRGDADILKRCLNHDYRYMPPLGRARARLLVRQMNERFPLNRRAVFVQNSSRFPEAPRAYSAPQSWRDGYHAEAGR